jgi:hypothetical protein
LTFRAVILARTRKEEPDVNRPLILAALVASLVWHPGCGSAPFAPSPSPQPGSGGAPPLPQPAPAPSQPAATLAIEELTVTEYPPTPERDGKGLLLHDYYSYVVRFLLRETSGNSGATIREVVVGNVPGEGETMGGDCLGDLRVPPGGTRDDFYTEKNVRRWSYRYPAPASPIPLERIRVIVTFKDDHGVIGTVNAEVMTRQ